MHLHYFVQYFYYRVFLMLFTVTTKRVQAQAIVPTINRAFLGIVALVDWKRNKSVLANPFIQGNNRTVYGRAVISF